MRRWKPHLPVSRLTATLGLAAASLAAATLLPACTTSERRSSTPTTVEPPADLSRAGLEFLIFTVSDDKGTVGHTLVGYDTLAPGRPAESSLDAADAAPLLADAATIADWRAAGLRLVGVPWLQVEPLLASLPAAGAARREWIVPNGEWIPLLEAGSLPRTTSLPIGVARRELFAPGTFRLLLRAWIVPGEADQRGIIPPTLRVEILPQHLPRRGDRSSFREALDGLKLDSIADRGPPIEPLRLRVDLTNNHAVVIVPEHENALWAEAPSPPPPASNAARSPRGPGQRNSATMGPPSTPPRGQPSPEPVAPNNTDASSSTTEPSTTATSEDDPNAAPVAGPPPPIALDLGNVMLSDITTRGRPRVKLVLALRAILPDEYLLLPSSPTTSPSSTPSPSPPFTTAAPSQPTSESSAHR